MPEQSVSVCVITKFVDNIPATDPIAARLATFIKLEIAIKGMTHAAIKMAPMDMATHRRWLQQNSSLSSLSFWETNADAVTV